MMRILRTVGVLTVLFMATLSTAAPRCENVFRGPPSEPTIQKTIEDLAALRLELDQARANGKSSVALSAMNADYQHQEQSLQKYLEETQGMTPYDFMMKLRSAIKNLQIANTIRASAEATHKKTIETIHNTVKVDGTVAVFRAIQPGSFVMGNPRVAKEQFPVTLSRPFEMMATPTTQQIWENVLTLAQKYFPGKYTLPLKPSLFSGALHPVERVNWIEVNKWLEACNELSMAGVPELSTIIIGHKAGDKYRLPTSAEWEYVAREEGRNTGVYQTDITVRTLDQIGWFEINSGGTTHPVAQKKPISFGGKEFYDMFGNVDEWTSDRIDINVPYNPGGMDPKGDSDGNRVITRSASYMLDQVFMELGARSASRDTFKGPIGFRIVRDLKKETP